MLSQEVSDWLAGIPAETQFSTSRGIMTAEDILPMLSSDGIHQDGAIEIVRVVTNAFELGFAVISG